jgi:hypothetical protein
MEQLKIALGRFFRTYCAKILGNAKKASSYLKVLKVPKAKSTAF